ncbi:hypothetical protein ES703_68118 [subsurface metagenome]
MWIGWIKIFFSKKVAIMIRFSRLKSVVVIKTCPPVFRTPLISLNICSTSIICSTNPTIVIKSKLSLGKANSMTYATLNSISVYFSYFFSALKKIQTVDLFRKVLLFRRSIPFTKRYIPLTKRFSCFLPKANLFIS